MSWKDKLSTFLFRPAAEEGLDEEIPTEQDPIEPLKTPEPAAAADDASVLELPADHPFYHLWELWKKESGQFRPLRLCLDEDGTLSPDLVEKEKSRLQASLKNACTARWKTITGRVRGKHAKKKTEAEPPPEGDPEPVTLDACPWFHISADKLYAWMLILPPAGGGAEATRDMIYQSLEGQKISYGLDRPLLDRLAHENSRYGSLYLVARGKPAFDGRNGNIVDYIPREIERVLEVDEFGQVDYTALNQIRSVEQGQEICRLIRPTEGEPGRTVQDQELPAKSGKSVPLPKGRNTEISEDGDALLASIAGHVEFSGRGFQVMPVLDIDGDVDFSTGSLKFVGDINVKGDVLSGFSVQAMGNVYVGGVIEAGSTVESGGDLTVVKGILGDGTTTIRSSGCIFAKYIENATIYVKENLQTDCVVNGRVYCDGEVQVCSGRGSIIGGQVWAAKKVCASVIGARSECRTGITVGGQPCADFDREQVRKELEELAEELEKLENQLDSPVRSSLMSKARMRQSVAELKLKQLEEALGAEKSNSREKSGSMECGIAYAGTELSMGDQFLRLRHEYHQCIARLVYGEIEIM